MNFEGIDTLQSSLLFRNIGGESLSALLDCLKPKIRKYKQKKIIITHGQSFKGIGIVASGKVALTKELYSGSRIMMEILSAGGIFGETVAFSEHKVWPVTVIAQEDSCLLFLPQKKIISTCANVCPSHTTMIMNMLQILSNKAYMLDKKIEHISAKNIRGKISSYLLDIYRQNENNEFTIPMKRHELADYLNIPRPSLSREMSLMRRAGIIDFHGKDITVNNLLLLEEAIL